MPTQLYSEEKLRTDFEGFEFTQLKEEKITLEEGTFHNGITTVMRMHALKWFLKKYSNHFFYTFTKKTNLGRNEKLNTYLIK